MSSVRNGYLALALVSLGAASRFVAAAPATQPSAPSRISELITQLGDADPQVCVKAEHALIRIGRNARPALREAMKSPDVEVGIHAGYTLSAIDDPLTPTYVTVDVDNAPLDRVLASLAEQTELSIGLRSEDASLAATKITLHAKEEPLLAVFAQLGEQADISPTLKEGAWTFRKGNGTWSRDLSSVQGPICIHMVSVMRQISASYNTPPVFNTSILMLERISSEGKLPILGIENGRVTRCLDGAGRPVDIHVLKTPGTLMTMDVHGHPVEPLALIDGVVDVIVGTGHDPIEVADLENAKDVKRVAGALRLTFESCRETSQKHWAARFLIFRDGRPDLTWEQLKQGLENQPPILKDSQGRPLGNWGGMYVLKDNGDQIRIEFHYDNVRDLGRGTPDSPVSLVWDVQTRPKSVSVAFHFRNVPIP